MMRGGNLIIPVMSCTEPENIMTNGNNRINPKNNTIASRIHLIPVARIIGHREYCIHRARVNLDANE
jgi:hypothetical protein